MNTNSEDVWPSREEDSPAERSELRRKSCEFYEAISGNINKTIILNVLFVKIWISNLQKEAKALILNKNN